MPPVPAQRRALSREDPVLSDEDVGFLFQIISRAERYPDADRLPYRVLFKEYDAAIEEHGPQADPGLALMRFLFRLGGKDVKGDTLFEKFEYLLQQSGIVIEFGNEENDTDAYTDNVPDLDAPSKIRASREDTTRSIQTPRPRRASFNSMYDVGDDPTTRSFINRPSSRSSLSRLQTGKPEFQIPIIADSGRAESTDRTQLIAQFMDVGRRLMSKMDSFKSAKKQSEELSSAVYEDRSKRMMEASRAKIVKSRHASFGSSDDDFEDDDDDDDDNDDDEEKEDLSLGSQDISEPIKKPALPPEMLYRPSLSDLLRDASTFNMYRQRAINRRILTQWMKKGAQARQAHRNMEMVAVNRDRATLLRQAFGTWNSIIRNKRQAAMTQRFFKHLEERAARARNLYLMTKAFTHWAAVTSDELEKTTAARHHILGVKYFNAWREITAVNVLKAQRFALHRPLQALKKKVDHIKGLESHAVLHHNSKLKHGFYWQWFWNLCDRRAPRWHDYCIKRRALLSWLQKFRTNRERIQEIDMHNKHSMLRSALQALSTRSKAIISAEQDAICIQRHRVLQSSFDEWKLQARLAPAASRVANTADNHILLSAYSQWVKRIEMLNQAREMDRRRIMRNSWVAWNDTLRCQALSARIEERLKIETMYKWILAERFSLMQRIREQRIKREVFSAFVTSIRETYTQLLYNADNYEERRNDDLLRSKLDSWRNRLALQYQREDMASEFYAPRLVQESLVAWKSKLQHVAKLEEWSRDARFYFAATRTLKYWHAATVDSAKRRRQEAYAKIRRLVKVNLASKAFSTWRSKTQDVVEVEQQALQLDRGKSLDIVSGLLDRWHEKTAKRLHECDEADISYVRKIAYNQLIRWAEGVVESRQLEEQAISVYRLHVLNQANTSLRKLSFRIFQIHSNAETAEAMKERNLRKHSRGMFRRWVDKARMHLEARDSPGPLRSPTRNLSRAAPNGTEQSIFDPWHVETPFKLGDFAPELQPPSTTPLATPNYMNSPSRRAARARALVRASTTPATPLQTPFASRLLREGVSIPTTSSRPNRSGRRTPLPASVRFVDQEPESPTSGRGSSNRRP
ncbi:Sfi1 spindle body protein-domain-containing protein [Aspergillus granulosus]|uniref:Sfi1 spindle body protein-domain-containing protein n=1 Tax=Aspergillus granulosus TaxID=176169 RepID=A0ABR4I5T7_9EURO